MYIGIALILREREKLEEKERVEVTFIYPISSFHIEARRNLRSFFKFDGYEWFDIHDKDKGDKLVGILIDLMKYQKDELRSSAASLLFNIYNVRRERGRERKKKNEEKRVEDEVVLLYNTWHAENN